eukprot:6288145-Alexandrium_andersonii.AAC.1
MWGYSLAPSHLARHCEQIVPLEGPQKGFPVIPSLASDDCEVHEGPAVGLAQRITVVVVC